MIYRRFLFPSSSRAYQPQKTNKRKFCQVLNDVFFVAGNKIKVPISALKNRNILTNFLLNKKLPLKQRAQELIKSPKTWGPPCWRFLYFFAKKFSPKNKNALFRLILNLAHVLPCDHCSKNYKHLIRRKGFKINKMREKYQNKQQYLKLIINIHNDVNAHKKIL